MSGTVFALGVCALAILCGCSFEQAFEQDSVNAMPVGLVTAPRLDVAGPGSQLSGVGLNGYVVKSSYEKTIKQFEAVPTTRPSKIGGTLFIGSSSFTKWKTLEKDMAQFNAINCGFGGSRTDDVLYYGKRIIEKLRPSRIVYYCGGNDVASRRPAEVVFENFKAFVAQAHQEFPEVPIYFVSQNLVPTRFKFAAECDRANAEVQHWVATVPNVYFIDAQPGLLDSQRHPIVSYFVRDGIHLNVEGYKIWQANIVHGLENASLASEKIKTAETSISHNMPS